MDIFIFKSLEAKFGDYYDFFPFRDWIGCKLKNKNYTYLIFRNSNDTIHTLLLNIQNNNNPKPEDIFQNFSSVELHKEINNNSTKLQKLNKKYYLNLQNNKSNEDKIWLNEYEIMKKVYDDRIIIPF